MLKDCDWSLDRDYKTGSENEPLQFYLDGLANSNEFSLLLGYFSSSAINLLSVGFATFISKGGKMKMVINHLLSSKDKEAVARANGETLNNVFDLTDVVSLGKVLDEYDQHFFECLTYLIFEKRIELKVIKPKNGLGIAHYKSGVFSDGIDTVGYKASCNFTLYGLSENLEELEAFLSWENGRSNKLIKKQLRLIDNYFSEKELDVEYVSINEIEVVLKDKFGKKDINELLVQEKQLLEKKQSLVSNEKIKKTISKLYEDIEAMRRIPRFPYSSGPRDYQIEALESWRKNGFQGIFAMATGTGKTLTALNCLLEEYKLTGEYRALILVPFKVLVDQWEKEAKQFNFQNIYKVSSSNSNWRDNIKFLTDLDESSISHSYIIIATYASFIGKEFQTKLSKFTTTNLLLIADEAHNLGSASISKVLPKLKIPKRIGLTATPKRVYDEKGSLGIEAFFNDSEPYTYSFSMERAIEDEILCQYDYFPIVVALTDSEMNAYCELSDKLASIFHQIENNSTMKKLWEILLLERKRIIHKAENKLSAFRAIIQELNSSDKLKYTLIYAPEGTFSEEAEVLDSYPMLNEDNRIIDYYSNVIRQEAPNTTVDQYTSTTEEREHILSNFTQGKINVLLSMKCLDEGVDIPRTEQAIFCSSTGNPRQLIQRRGRILRKHPEKHTAKIYDLVVVPWVALTNSSFDIERKLVRSELVRVVQFAFMARNSHYARRIMEPICQYFDLNLDKIHDTTLEEKK